VDWENGLDGFCFNQHASTHEHIETQRLLLDEGLITYLDDLLIERVQPPQFELFGEAPFIDRFNETGAFAVYFNGSANDGLRKTGGFGK
jgi:hypothetical protein